MYGSLAFRPVWPVEAWPRLSLVAGIAMRQALVDATGGAFALKWPNDILLDGRKCAGILSESEGDLVVVGCGVNLWWPGAPDGVGVVYGTDPGPDLAPVLAGNWAGALLEGLDGGPDAWRRDEYRRFCTTLGADITWEPAGAGKALDIAMDGGLVVDTPGGPVTLSSGEVRTVRRATVARDTQFTDDNDGGRPQ